MTIFSQTISAVSYEVYGGSAAAADYLLASIGDGATAYRALATDDQSRMLIAATRYIDSLFWLGTATGLAGVTATTLQFPRSGLTDQYGNVLDATNVPVQVVSAAFELAAIVAADPAALDATDTGSNVQSLGAGPAQIAFFRPTSAQDGNATRLPTVVDRLLGRWLATSAAASALAAFVSGTNASQHFLRGRSCACGLTPCCCAEQRPDVAWPA